MLSNPKTTLVGYAILLAVAVYVAYGFYSGKPMDIQTVIQILTGVGAGGGLIAASDGGH